MSEAPAKTRKDIETHIITQAWKDESYKQELLDNPKAVIEREFGVQLPTEVSVNIQEESPTNLYFVLPMRPNTTSELSEEQLEAVAGGVTPAAAAVSATAVYTGYVLSQALTD